MPRLYATLVGIFSGAALILAALGVYGVMAYSVTQRQREIGVRLALGAAPSGIQRMIFLQGGRLAAIGLLVGLTLSMMLGQFLSKLLFGVTPFDVPTLVMVPTVLGVVTVLASWLPARRAMRLDPVIRQERRRAGRVPLRRESPPASKPLVNPLVEVLQATERRVVAGR